jgi:hypothetical protein
MHVAKVIGDCDKTLECISRPIGTLFAAELHPYVCVLQPFVRQSSRDNLISEHLPEMPNHVAELWAWRRDNRSD